MRRKWTYQQGRKPGRPPIDAELERWILQVARDNPGLGYEKLAGELRKLGFQVSKTTVSIVLERYGVPPAPERGRQGSSWRVFLNCPAVEKLDAFRAVHKRGIGWPSAVASNSAGVR